MKGNPEQIRLQVERDKKIRAEFNRIKRIFKDVDIDKNLLKALEGLCKDAAFMRVSLDELKESLTLYGNTEIFEQGAQRFERERPAVKTFLNYLKQYSVVMKQIIDQLPKEQQEQEESELFYFIQEAQKLRAVK